MVGRWWRECIIAFLLTFPSMARSINTAIAAGGPPVKAGYWYCDNNMCPTPVASIPSEFFTHLFAAFAKVKPTTYEVTFPEAHGVQFSTFTLSVQQRNRNVRTLLSIGGVSSTSTFASMASNPNTRESFINSSIKLARSNDFHGLCIHWLYPSTAEDMTNLGSLLTEWSAAMKHESDLTGNGRLLLVAAVYFKPTHLTFLYPVDAIAGSLDWINLVAYDFYNPALSRNATGPFAALYGGNDPIIPLYGDLGVEAWIQAPVAAQQIVLGLPFYGAAWLLVDATKTEIFAPANGPADGHAAGVYIDPKDGTILYNQIKYFIETHPEGNEKYSADYVLDYFSAEKTWIGYNGIKSITAKVTYARDKTLLGYYAWHVDGDRDGTLSGAASGAWPIPGPKQDSTGTGTNTGTGTGIGTGTGTGNAATATATSTSTASGVGTVTGTVTSTITDTNTNTNTFFCINTCPAQAPAPTLAQCEH